MMRFKIGHISRTLTVLFVSTVALSGCGENYLYKPTFQETKKIQVLKKKFEYTRPTVAMDAGELRHISNHYDGHGEGLVEIIVTYNSKVQGNSAMRATDEAARIADTFRSNGVTNIQANILPVMEDQSKTVISYVGYVAQKPEGCKNLLDEEDTDSEILPDYKYGCTMMDLMARQVVRPSDLLGKDKTSPNSASRDAIVVDGYRSYENVEISGGSTSELQ